MKGSAVLGESGYARRPLDLYVTPPWVTAVLLQRVMFRGPVWEPAAGEGHICRKLKEYGYEVIASDITDHGYPLVSRADFLSAPPPTAPSFSIITNPPYSDAEAFVRRALEMTRRNEGQVAMLLRHEWDCAASRRDLFEDGPFAQKLTLTRRPKWSDEDKASPRHNFAWFLWDWRHAGPATLGWLP